MRGYFRRSPVRALIFEIGVGFKAIFYYFPLWLLGNRWCFSCCVRIKPTEYCAEVTPYIEPNYLCEECEKEWKR